jgi:YVTN family beta-propeller protein
MRGLMVLALVAATSLAAVAAVAAGPKEAIPGASGTLWVTEQTLNTVTAYDAATGEVLRTTPVGTRPIGITSLPGGSAKTYSSDERSNQMSVIDEDTGGVVKQIPMGLAPHHLMLSPNNQYVYVAEFGHNQIGVVDTDLDERVAGFVASADPNGGTHAVWISENGRHLYATNSRANTISLLDAQTGALQWEVPIGSNPSEILVTRDEKTAYVSIRNENAIRVVDLTGDSPIVVATQAIGTQPDTLQLTNDGDSLIVGLRGTPATMAIMNTDTLAVRQVALTGTTTGHEWLSANGKYTFIAVETPGGIAVVDNEAGAQIDLYPYPAGQRPHGVYYEPSRLR